MVRDITDAGEDIMDKLFVKVFLATILLSAGACSTLPSTIQESPQEEPVKTVTVIKPNTSTPKLVKVTPEGVIYNVPHKDGVIPQECCFYPVGFRYPGR